MSGKSTRVRAGYLGSRTNQIGLNMSGGSNGVGHKGSLGSTIGSRVQSNQKNCGPVMYQGQIWRTNTKPCIEKTPLKGTQTVNNVVTVATSNGVQFEGPALDGHHAILKSVVAGASVVYTLPNKTGTVAMISDIPVVGAGGLTTNDFTDTLHTKLNGIEASATADQTAAEIRTLVGSATDSNVFTDAHHTKLNGIEASATADQTAAEIRTLVGSATDSNVFTDAHHTKLNGIEASATADQTAAEIRTLVGSATDSNVFTDVQQSKLNDIEPSADVTDATNVTAAGALMDSEVTNLAQVKAFDSSDHATAAQGTTADSAQQPPTEGAFANGDKTKLDDIEASATADQTAAEIRTLVGSATDSNVFTDAHHTKLNGIEASATADQTAAEIRTLVGSATDSNVFTDVHQSKLDEIEPSADVTDATNVTAAGALMDSEVTNLAQVKAFDSSDHATAAQGTKADSAQQPPSEGAFANGDKTKLDEIEASADVTDAANVKSSLNASLGGLTIGADSDTITIPGNLTVIGTHTVNNVVTVSTSNGVQFEGAAADGHDAILKSVVAGASVVYTLPNKTGTVAMIGDILNITDADHTKLNAIEASADVTDTANVTAAGALMDSEVTNLAQVKAFNSSDYATAEQGTKADSAQQPPSEGAFANGDKTKLNSIHQLLHIPLLDNNLASSLHTHIMQVVDSEVTNLAQVKDFNSSDYLSGNTALLGQVTDSGKKGWRFTSSHPNNYGDIGDYAVDFSTQPDGDSVPTRRGATGDMSTAMGYYTHAGGLASTAMGDHTTATAPFSTAMGTMTETTGLSSTAMGNGTIASDFSSLVIGQYNSVGSAVTGSATKFDPANAAFVIGNGWEVMGRVSSSDAFVVYSNGNANLAGTLTVDGTTSLKAALNMNSNVIANVKNPADAQDAATKAYVDLGISNLVNGAPGALDTLNELANALGDDANYASTITGKLNTIESGLAGLYSSVSGIAITIAEVTNLAQVKAFNSSDYLSGNTALLGQVTESGKKGWRFNTSSNNTHGPIGIQAIDFSYQHYFGDGGSTGDHSTAMGVNTTAQGNSSTTMGNGTIASDYGSLVIGQYNSVGSTVTGNATKFDPANAAFVIGNGWAEVDEEEKEVVTSSDAFVVYSNGNANLAGTLTVGAVTYPNTDGTVGQVLSTNGSGDLSWATNPGPQGIQGLQGIQGIQGIPGDAVNDAGKYVIDGWIDMRGRTVFNAVKNNCVDIAYYDVNKDSVFAGSGWLYKQDGIIYVITAAHVGLIQNNRGAPPIPHLPTVSRYSSVINATLYNESVNKYQTYRCKVIGADCRADLMVLRLYYENEAKFVNISTNSGLSFGNSRSMSQGDDCYVIGNPLGFDVLSISHGNIRDPKHFNSGNVETMFVTAPTMHGNSGGPILDRSGNVIGLLTFAADGYTALGGGISQFMMEALIKKIIYNSVQHPLHTEYPNEWENNLLYFNATHTPSVDADGDGTIDSIPNAGAFSFLPKASLHCKMHVVTTAFTLSSGGNFMMELESSTTAIEHGGVYVYDISSTRTNSLLENGDIIVEIKYKPTANSFDPNYGYSDVHNHLDWDEVIIPIGQWDRYSPTVATWFINEWNISTVKLKVIRNNKIQNINLQQTDWGANKTFYYMSEDEDKFLLTTLSNPIKIPT